MASKKISVLALSATLLAYRLTAAHVSGSHEKDIAAAVLNNYGYRDVRPVRNVSQSLNVTMRLLIAHIVEFDEPKQQLTVIAWQKTEWQDEFLVWDPDDHGGITEMHVVASDIWVPRLVLLENVHYDFEKIKEVEVIVSFDGSVIWYTPVIFRTSCKVQVRHFPFDDQRCNITLAPWTYDMSSLNLRYFDDEDAKQAVFSENGVWTVVDIQVTRVEQQYACCDNPFSHIVYTLTFQRASLFYILSIIIPSVLLTTITLTVFCIPPESGEKISLGMTNLLAFVLFQQLIAGIMPPLGDETSVLTIYIFCMVVVGCASIFVSVYVLGLFHTAPEKPVPRTVVKLLKYFSCQTGPVTWQAVARMLDKAMFVLFLVASVFIVMFLLIAFAK